MKPIQTWNSNAEAPSVSVKVSGVSPDRRKICRRVGKVGGGVGGNSVIFLPTSRPHTGSESLSSDCKLFKFTPFYHSATTQTARDCGKRIYRESLTHIGAVKRNVNELFPSLFRSCHCSENWGREMCLREFKNENAGKCCRKMAWDGRILILSGYFYESAKHNTHPNREWSSSPRCRRHL